MRHRPHLKSRLARLLDRADVQAWLHDDRPLVGEHHPARRLGRRLARAARREDGLATAAPRFLAGGFFGVLGILGGLVAFGLLMAFLGSLFALAGALLRVAVVVAVIWFAWRLVRGARRAPVSAVLPYR